MDDAGTCAGIRPQLGVYLTGAIAPADRVVVVRHLTACDGCRAELAGLAGLPALLRRPPVQAAGRRVARRRRRWLLVAAAFVLVVAAGAGWALHLIGPSGRGPRAEATMLQTRTIGDVTVLTDDEGYTLYWFGPDSATKSACQGSCARSWLPVTGPATWGPGVTGSIGAIVRPGGALQATYDGHPLYTTTADTGPGQTKGNDVWSHGGEWHEVTVPGRAG